MHGGHDGVRFVRKLWELEDPCEVLEPIKFGIERSQHLLGVKDGQVGLLDARGVGVEVPAS